MQTGQQRFETPMRGYVDTRGEEGALICAGMASVRAAEGFSRFFANQKMKPWG